MEDKPIVANLSKLKRNLKRKMLNPKVTVRNATK